MGGDKRRRLHRAAVMAVIVGLVSGCGGGDGGDDAAEGDPATSPEEFAQRFSELTGVELAVTKGPLGIDIDQAKGTSTGLYGDFGFTWATDDVDRAIALGGSADIHEPNEEGVVFSDVGGSFNANREFGDTLVVSWFTETMTTNAQWDRVVQATEAAYLGDLELVPEEDRACSSSGIDPFSGEPGTCLVAGVPVTYVNGGEPLVADTLTARIRGYELVDTIRSPIPIPPGPYVIVSYSVENTGDEPITFLFNAFRLGDRKIEQDFQAGFTFQSDIPPIAPGETFEAVEAFRIPETARGDVPARAAFVIPIAPADDGDFDLSTSQGWLRLDGAPTDLPDDTRQEGPTAAPAPVPAPVPPPPGPGPGQT